MRSALTENLRGGATPCSLFLVLTLLSAALAIPTPALAANVSFSIPTKVELKVKADGTVIAPSAEAWQVRNLGDEPIQLTSVGAEGFSDGETVAANSGSWSLSVNAAASQTGTMTIQPKSQTGVSWSVPALGSLGAKISSRPYTAGSISFGFQAVDDLEPDPNGTAFAVYSADDNSLDFYKRDGTPHVGHLFNGKTVTEVYSDIEDYSYKITDSGIDHRQPGNAPWWPRRAEVKSVKIFDTIRPKSMCGWFYWLVSCTSIDLGPIDTSRCTDMYGTFDRCSSLKSIDVSMMDTSKVTSFSCAFFGDENLTSIDISNWDLSSAVNMSFCFKNCTALKDLVINPPARFYASFDYTFQYCSKLQLDCSDWNVYERGSHIEYNSGAPGVTLPKPWQTSAFAVYSETDNSLDFYKRENWTIPTAGSTFNGKTATNIYTGFETKGYYYVKEINGDTTCPWYEHHADIKSVTVTDRGVTPENMGFWFQRFTNCETIDLSKLDTSKVRSLQHAFGHCYKLTSLDMSNFSTSPLQIIESMCTHCSALETIDLTGWNFSLPTGWMFSTCENLKTAQMPNWKSFAGTADAMFTNCHSLTLDLSDVDVSKVTSHSGFNSGAPGVTLPKAWQTSTNNMDADGGAVAPSATETAPAVPEQPAGTDTHEGDLEAELGQTEPAAVASQGPQTCTWKGALRSPLP